MDYDEYSENWEEISSNFFLMLEEDNIVAIINSMMMMVNGKLQEAIIYKKHALEVALLYENMMYLDDDELKNKIFNDYGSE